MSEVLESELDYEVATSPFKEVEVAEGLQDNVGEEKDQVEEAREVQPEDYVEIEGKAEEVKVKTEVSESGENTDEGKVIEDEEGELEDGEISEEGEVESRGRKRGREGREEREVCRHFRAGRCSWGKVTSLLPYTVCPAELPVPAPRRPGLGQLRHVRPARRPRARRPTGAATPGGGGE